MRKVYHIVSNKVWGGGEQYVYDLAQLQLQNGMQVEIFCKPEEVIINKFLELGVSVYPLRLNGAIDFKSAWKMAAIVTEGSLIHAHNFKDAFTASYARKLSHCKDLKVIASRHLTRKGKNTLLYQWLYKQLDWLVFDSNIARDVFMSTKPLMDVGKTSVIHTSIVLPENVVSAGIRQEYEIEEDEVIAMYHGRLDPEKGLDTLLTATSMNKEKKFKLVLVGKGTDKYTEYLHHQTEMMGIADKVIMTGFRHPVLPYVKDADFGILASVVREGCPLSPQEYMSQGHPVVVTNNGGQREYVVNERNGLLINPGDAGQLATAMERMIDDEALRNKLGQQARKDFGQLLSYDHLFDKIKQLYEYIG